jgi:hypothetical protein
MAMPHGLAAAGPHREPSSSFAIAARFAIRHPFRMSSIESEARKALTRLRRAVEKSRRELRALTGAIRGAEGEDFPATEYAAAEARIGELLAFLEEESQRLEAKILLSGGLEPGRVRRSSS